MLIDMVVFVLRAYTSFLAVNAGGGLFGDSRSCQCDLAGPFSDSYSIDT